MRSVHSVSLYNYILYGCLSNLGCGHTVTGSLKVVYCVCGGEGREEVKHKQQDALHAPPRSTP